PVPAATEPRVSFHCWHRYVDVRSSAPAPHRNTLPHRGSGASSGFPSRAAGIRSHRKGLVAAGGGGGGGGAAAPSAAGVSSSVRSPTSQPTARSSDARALPSSAST